MNTFHTQFIDIFLSEEDYLLPSQKDRSSVRGGPVSEN